MVDTPPKISSFADWIQLLLKRQELALPPHAEQEVYTLHFEDKPSVHFVRTPDGQGVDVLVEADTLASVHAADKLLRLLTLNACHASDYTVAVSVQPPEGAVVLWTRQRWRALDTDAAQALLQAVLDKSDAVRTELRKQGPRAQAGAAAVLGRNLIARTQERA